MTPTQCRSARALIGWTQDDLARSAEVGEVTLRQFERGRRRASPCDPKGVAARALEEASVKFIDANKGGGPGIRLREGRR